MGRTMQREDGAWMLQGESSSVQGEDGVWKGHCLERMEHRKDSAWKGWCTEETCSLRLAGSQWAALAVPSRTEPC